MATELTLRLAISIDEATRYYNGSASTVLAYADNGQSVRFPARYIRPFIDQYGVNGVFKIRFDQNHKLLALEKVESGRIDKLG